jgi:hypothetical protein
MYTSLESINACFKALRSTIFLVYLVKGLDWIMYCTWPFKSFRIRNNLFRIHTPAHRTEA